MNNILTSEYYLKKEMICKDELQQKKLEGENLKLKTWISYSVYRDATILKM